MKGRPILGYPLHPLITQKNLWSLKGHPISLDDSWKISWWMFSASPRQRKLGKTEESSFRGRNLWACRFFVPLSWRRRSFSLGQFIRLRFGWSCLVVRFFCCNKPFPRREHDIFLVPEKSWKHPIGFFLNNSISRSLCLCWQCLKLWNTTVYEKDRIK